MSTSRFPRRILISGGTSGIGFACAQRLSEAGDRVWVLGSSERTVDGARDQLELAGASVCDVSDAKAVDVAFGEAGRIFWRRF